MARHAVIDALTFDLDDTLWDNRPVMELAEQGHYTWLDDALAAWQGVQIEQWGRYAERFPLSAYQDRRMALAQQYPLRRGDFTWIRERALIEMMEEFGLPRSAAFLWAAAAMDRFMDLRHQLQPYPQVGPLLDRLGEHYRLAAITNGNADVTRLPIARHFPVTIAAGELLAPKPDARPFLAALARLGTPASRAMHVGDSWQEDVMPAQRLGMRVAWIDRHDDSGRSLPPGVYRLRHVSELPALLQWLDSRLN
ncbi:HAD family hydrolase [Litchfieldella xinjiangensis]|uniref:HAD family hydrolase n=1 Tax=Litchfieldella xinjiangensis TaxID=1166948 RepID=UPI0005B9EDF7|nr:HAD family hydrolase [Halomonas xinjiangensis]